jgi:hypothetical protein
MPHVSVGWANFYATQPQNTNCNGGDQGCEENQTEMVTLTPADIAAGSFTVNLG